jgi:hypothetical protein
MPIGDVFAPKDEAALYTKIYRTAPGQEHEAFPDVHASVSTALKLLESSNFVQLGIKGSAKSTFLIAHKEEKLFSMPPIPPDCTVLLLYGKIAVGETAKDVRGA